MEYTQEAKITGNIIKDIDWFGLRIESDSNSVIQGNMIIYTRGPGITLDGGEGTIIKDNQISHNLEEGIEADDCIGCEYNFFLYIACYCHQSIS